MSGTSVENKLSELWSIMQFTNPVLLGSLTNYTKRFVSAIQNDGDVVLSKRLKRMSAPFVMRRLKSDRSIISDLPDKVERNRLTEALCVALLGLVKLGWFRGFCVWYFWAVTGAFVYL